MVCLTVRRLRYCTYTYTGPARHAHWVCSFRFTVRPDHNASCPIRFKGLFFDDRLCIWDRLATRIQIVSPSGAKRDSAFLSISGSYEDAEMKRIEMTTGS